MIRVTRESGTRRVVAGISRWRSSRSIDRRVPPGVGDSQRLIQASRAGNDRRAAMRVTVIGRVRDGNRSYRSGLGDAEILSITTAGVVGISGKARRRRVVAGIGGRRIRWTIDGA